MVLKKSAVTVVGAGRMGVGIALAFSLKGFRVNLIDAKERTDEAYRNVAKKVKEVLRSNIAFLKRVGFFKGEGRDVFARISLSRGLGAEPFEVPYVFEAVPERPEWKIAVFRKIVPFLGAHTMLASTTSTIDLKTLKTGVARPERLMITHWLNPAFIIPLVEIAVSEETDASAIAKMKGLLSGIGKVPVVLKDSPGFIVPRIQALAMNEAIRIYEEGVASAEEIDRAIRTGFAFRLAILGLLEFVDLGGLDILYYADDFLSSALGSERFEKPRLVEEKMGRGEIGPRAGKGIFDYQGVDVRARFEERYGALVKLLRFMKKHRWL